MRLWRRDAVTTTTTSAAGGGQDPDKSYKQKNPIVVRQQQVASIQAKFPGKIPVIVERFKKEKTLPPLDKAKFLVPSEILMSQFVNIVRNRLHLSSNQPLYFLIDNRSIACMSSSMAELYAQFRDEDGFLYITYAAQEIFG